MWQGAWNVVRIVAVAWGCACGAWAQEEPEVVWAVTTKGPLELNDQFGIHGIALASDGAGITYVAGIAACPRQTESWHLAARDADGLELWRTEIVDAYFNCTALKLDPEGNLVVGGTMWDGALSNIMLIKVKSDGNKLWSVVRGGGPGVNLWLLDFVVTPDGMIATLCTRRVNAAPAADCYIAAFSSQGAFAWEASYDAGAPHVNELPMRMAADGAGNIYATSASSATPEESDYAILKYAASGQRLWVTRYRHEGYRKALPLGVAATSDGGVVVTGIHTDDGPDTVTVKCDSAGAVLYAAVIPQGNSPRLAVDSVGRPCVVAIQSSDIVKIVKYATDGAENWTRDLPFSVWNQGDARICMDGRDNMALAMNVVRTETGVDVDTLMYDSAGNELWHNSHDEGSGYNEYVTGLAVTADGRVSVGCASMISTAPLVGLALLQYNPDGTTRWRVSTRDNNAVEESPGALAVDSSGAIYMARASTGMTTREDIVTAKYSSGGSLLWERRLALPGFSAEKPGGIGLDGAGNVYVAGSADEDLDIARLVVAKYSAEGELAWSVQHDDPALHYQRFAAASVSPEGDTYVVGCAVLFQGENYHVLAFTLKYDTEGRLAWRTDFPQGSGYAFDAQLAPAPGGGVYVTATGGADRVTRTVRYRADGTDQWVFTHPCPAGEFPSWQLVPAALCVDASGNAYVAGQLTYDDEESISTSDAFVQALDSEGRFLWDVVYSGPGRHHDRLQAAALGPDGSLYIAASAGKANDAWACLTMAIDAGGTLRWDRLFSYGPFPVTVPRGLTVDAAGNVTVLALAESLVGSWQGATPVLLGYDSVGGASYALPVAQFGTVDDFRPQLLALHPSGDRLLALRTSHSGPCFDWPRMTLIRFGKALPGGSFIRGDASADGTVDIADAVCVLGYLFGAPEVPCKNAACLDALDANDDEIVNVADPIYLLGYLFAGGSAPPFPGPVACGRDFTGTGLDCVSQPVCTGR